MCVHLLMSQFYAATAVRCAALFSEKALMWKLAWGAVISLFYGLFVVASHTSLYGNFKPISSPEALKKRPTQNHPQQFYASQFEICFWLDSTRSAAAVHKAHSLCIQWMNSEFNFDKTSQNKSLIAVHEIVKPCEPLFRVPRHPWIRPTMPAIYTWNFPWSDVADVIILDCIFV